MLSLIANGTPYSGNDAMSRPASASAYDIISSRVSGLIHAWCGSPASKCAAIASTSACGVRSPAA
ncbi:hypothetical protein [Burkholderia cenocepacia]|uniref:hypothetical protein n=1 Tax=Burkholderia cenocepacia TaxID=95486 RepID=UPI001F2B3F1D|nr:hypothetical protein [Burkholderia cenocepacia]